MTTQIHYTSGNCGWSHSNNTSQKMLRTNEYLLIRYELIIKSVFRELIQSLENNQNQCCNDDKSID